MNELNELLAMLDHVSERLAYLADQENVCSYNMSLDMERRSWETHKIANELRHHFDVWEDKYVYAR